MRRCAGIAVTGLIALALGGAGVARADAVHVQVAPDSCPSADLLAQKLGPLLGADRVLVVGAAPPVGAAARRAAIVDQGERYTIEIEGLLREIDDPARDCVERARVAAVLIALNLKASEPPPPPPAEPSAEPSEPPPPPGLVIGVRLLGEAAYASAIEQGAGGASLGVFLGHGAFWVGLDVGVLSPAEVALQERGTLSPKVALLRLPIVLAASYRPRLGDFSLGPSAGLALDLLRLQGEDVQRPQTELRLNPGVFGAAELCWHFAPSLLAMLRLGLSAFPRAYELSVDPEGALGRTPELWLSASLGLGWHGP